MRLGGRLDTATPAEKVGIVHDLVQSIDVEAERDQAGRPVSTTRNGIGPTARFGRPTESPTSRSKSSSQATISLQT